MKTVRIQRGARLRPSCGLLRLAVEARGIGSPEAGSCKFPLKGVLGSKFKSSAREQYMLLTAEISPVHCSVLKMFKIRGAELNKPLA